MLTGFSAPPCLILHLLNSPCAHPIFTTVTSLYEFVLNSSPMRRVRLLFFTSMVTQWTISNRMGEMADDTERKKRELNRGGYSCRYCSMSIH
ncbi:MAG: hypothetical protein J3R72DRAFT_446758 [Linnemannia gamsii]|nr:MAG: hypothetical protein J3R72DRAFT_446758 [Linnemannia gamsii]